MDDSPITRAAAVKVLARELGFDLVGIARPEPSAHGDAFRAWVAAGKQGEMEYLGRNLERELSARAGLGWIGKNTLLIHPRHGSWFLLGELILSLELVPDEPLADHCGTCRRCIEACPTHAITPHSVDAARCISYLT